MELQKLRLKNYKGLRNFTFEPNGQSVTVWGANESGKTTLGDALRWLLTGKDMDDRSPDSFGIKTRDKNGEVIHGLEHEVEGVFDCFTLRRIYQEKWTRKRGAANETFSGHTTDYYIDDEPVKASDYQEAVDEVISDELLKILSTPDYFPEQMHWKERREVLFDLVGEINTDDIILSYGDLERYPAVLDGKDHEAREKILKEQRRKLDKELDNKPDRIDEVSRMIEDVEGVDEAREKVQELKAKKEKIEAKRSEVKSGGTIAELKVKRQELQAEYKELENKHYDKVQEALTDQRQKVSNIQDKVDGVESEFREAKRVYESSLHALKSAKAKIDKAKKQAQEIKERDPKPANAFEPEKCPVCEQTMPDADEHDYEAYLEEFNAKNADQIKEAKQRLESFREEHEECKADHVAAKQKASNLKGKLNQRKEALRKAKISLGDQKADQPDFANEEIDQQVEEIDQKIANHRQEKQAQLEKLDAHLESLDEQIEQAQSKILQAEQNKKYNARIQELQNERKEVAEQLEQAEADLHLMEEFVRARSAYVTDKVNEKFEHVTWKLFEEQINGGITETCTAVFKGVPFDEGLNNAGRIKAGLEIISVLSKHYDKSAPVVIDNSESITDIPDLDLQIIALEVSAEDKELRVESGIRKNQLEVA